MRPVRWSFHAQRTAAKLAREVRGRMLGAWKRQTVAWLRPDDAGGVPIRTLSVTLDAVLVGSIATCTGVVTGWSPATVATYRSGGATVASGTITLDDTGGYSFPLTVNPGVTTIIVEAIDRGLVAHAADQVEIVLPSLTITAYANQPLLPNDATVVITGTISNEIGSITAMKVLWVNGSTTIYQDTGTLNSTFTFNAPSYGDGDNLYVVDAWDSAGRKVTSTPMHVSVPAFIGHMTKITFFGTGFGVSYSISGGYGDSIQVISATCKLDGGSPRDFIGATTLSTASIGGNLFGTHYGTYETTLVLSDLAGRHLTLVDTFTMPRYCDVTVVTPDPINYGMMHGYSFSGTYTCEWSSTYLRWISLTTHSGTIDGIGPYDKGLQIEVIPLNSGVETQISYSSSLLVDFSGIVTFTPPVVLGLGAAVPYGTPLNASSGSIASYA